MINLLKDKHTERKKRYSIWGDIGKFGTVIFVIASVKDKEREGQGHTSESLLRHSAT
jgi:hypothetical protein